MISKLIEVEPIQEMYRQGDDQAEELAYDYQPIQHTLQNDIGYTQDYYNDGGEDYSRYLESGGTQQEPGEPSLMSQPSFANLELTQR